MTLSRVPACIGHRYRAGAAYVLFGRAEGTFEASYDLKSADVVDGTNAASLLGLRAQNALGIGVGSAGDMNGDGISDLWVSECSVKPLRCLGDGGRSSVRPGKVFDLPLFFC